MELGQWIGSITRVRSDPSARETIRRRLLAAAALTLFLVGLFAALGISILVLLVLSAAALVGIGGGLIAVAGPSARLLRLRRQPASLPRSRPDAVARLGRGFLVGARVQSPRLATIVASAARRAGNPCRTAVNTACQVVVTRTVRLRDEMRSRPAMPDRGLRRGKAFQLNAEGSQFRREGSYAQSAERHRDALAMLRELGDRRAVALTLNNLALAIERSGDGGTAVAYFEEAVGILRELQDDECEGQVIANLGFAQRRCGRRDDSENLLQTALEKLSPDSSAYRAVEAELLRAS